MDDQISPERLRALVREVLRDALPALAAPRTSPGSSAPPGAPAPSGPPAPPAPPASPGPPGPPGSAGPPAPRAGDGQVQEVRLETSAELHDFVLHILRLADNPKRRADILAGRLRFTLAERGGGPVAPAQRIDKGAVTERAVIAAAKAGAALVLGPRAMLTPLAADKARALGVRVEKER